MRGARAGLVDFARVIVMRTGSDFDRPYPGQTAAENLFAHSPGFAISVANIPVAGVPVVTGIIAGWDAKFKDGITPGSKPLSIVVRDGVMWFSEAAGDHIGRLTTDGTITEFPIPSKGSQPRAMCPHPDGSIWFVQTSANGLCCIDRDGGMTEYKVTTPDASLRSVCVGPDGDLWFTDARYGHWQNFRPEPVIRPQVYRFEPSTGVVQSVADDFVAPNGIEFR